MSLPSSRMRPPLGLSTPVNRLMSVVLPAPFGPISAWRAPFSTVRETLSVATMPPKFFASPLVSSTGGIGLSGFAREARPHRALKRVGALGHLGRELKDVRPGDPKHQNEHDRDHDAVQEGQLQHGAEREDRRSDERAVDAPEQD